MNVAATFDAAQFGLGQAIGRLTRYNDGAPPSAHANRSQLAGATTTFEREVKPAIKELRKLEETRAADSKPGSPSRTFHEDNALSLELISDAVDAAAKGIEKPTTRSTFLDVQGSRSEARDAYDLLRSLKL